MCDMYNDEEMYLDGFKYDEIVGMLGPGLDNNFLDSVMGELDSEENIPDAVGINGIPLSPCEPAPFADDEHDSKLFLHDDINSFTSSLINSDSMLMSSMPGDVNMINGFIKREPRPIKPQPSMDQPLVPKPILTSTPQQTAYCNIKPAPPRKNISTGGSSTPVAKSAIPQYQNVVKPLSIQNNVSVVPQIVNVQMYTAAKVQPVAAVTTTGPTQFPNNTLVFLDTSSSNKVSGHRVLVKHGRVGKRLAHNATEKKYRLSISSGIESLKNLVVGEDAKLQKSAILRKAVDFILALQKQNRALRRQNAELIKAAKIGNVKELLLPTGNYKSDQYNETDSYGAITPPRSDVSNPSLSPSYSDHSLPSSPCSRDDSDSESTSSSSRGMAPHERLSLFAFMFAVIIFNPFGNVIRRVTDIDTTYESGSRRTLLDADLDQYDFEWDKLGLSLFVWLFNIFILFMCLIKMLVYGDPILKSKSKCVDEFWKHKKHAEVEFAKGNGAGANRELTRCLQSYGIFLPTTKRETVTATTWQFLRMCLHRLWIGKFLSRKAGGLFCSSEIRIQALTSAKELSLIFHRLNQINLTSNMADSNGLFMSLYAVNMAEAASDLMSPNQLVEIYLTAALRVKHSYPKIFQYFSRHYLNKAKSEISKLCADIPTEYQWLLTSYGHKFFISHSFVYNRNAITEDSVFSSLGNKADPMAYVMKDYREHLLERAFQCLIGMGNNNPTNESVNTYRINEVLHYTQLLMDSIVKDSSATYISCIAERRCCKDPLAHWWASILSIATYWILGDFETSETVYSQIEKLPAQLADSPDVLPKAFFIAFKSKRAIMNKNGPKVLKNIYAMCKIGTDLLDGSLKGTKSVRGMKMLAQFVACNWLLETRTALWELEYNTNEKSTLYVQASSEIMSNFQRDLNSLRIITEHISNAESRVFLYEAIYRLMAGAAPGPTHELLNRNMTYRHIKSSIICGKDRNHDWDGGEREKADAIFIANKYLPTNLFSDSRVRRGLLMEAISILEKIGDKNKLDECNHLLSSIGNSVSN